MESLLRDVRVKRALTLVGVVLVALGIAAGLSTVTVVGSVLALVGLVSGGGA